MPNKIIHLPEIDSTNAEAKRYAERGEREAVWIYADTQTAGRGRRGRDWYSPKGNLMTTLYLPIELESRRAGELAFVAGLAICDCVRDLLSDTQCEVSIKYPNDVLVDGAKISGLLLETATSEKNINWMAIGIGINLAAHPDDTPYPATSIAAAGATPPTPADALAMLDKYFDKYLALWQTQSCAALLAQWRKHAHHIGEAIEVRLQNETKHGIFESIDDSGTLILRGADGGTEHINSGDIFFPTATGAGS